MIEIRACTPDDAAAVPSLNLDRAPHGINNARELGKETVAGILDDAAAVLGDLRVDQLAWMGLEPLVRPLLIRPHQARVSGHVGGEDRGEAADKGAFLAQRSIWPEQVYLETRGGPSVEIRWLSGRSMHSTGVARIALLIGRVRDLVLGLRTLRAPTRSIVRLHIRACSGAASLDNFSGGFDCRAGQEKHRSRNPRQ